MALVGAAVALAPVRYARAADPVWTPIPAQDWVVGVPVYLDLTTYCTDADGDSLTFDLSPPLPAGVSLNGSVISGVPSSPYSTAQIVAVADDHPIVAGVSSEGQPQPVRPRLVASPNPFSGAVRIFGQRRTAVESIGTLRVFNVSGALVYERPVRIAGDHYEIAWDGRSAGGMKLPSGVYLVSVKTGSETARTRLVLAQ